MVEGRRGVCIALVVILWAVALVPGWAAPPTLTPAGEIPATLQLGQELVVRMTYKDADNDRPRDALLIAEAATGTSKIPPAEMPTRGDFRNGVTLEWKTTFRDDGEYRVHFEGASTTGKPGMPEFRWPTEPGSTHTLSVVNPVHRWVMLGIGLGVSLLFLPMLVFFVVRGISRSPEPGATARFALLVGILAAASWYGYLFWSVHGVTSVIIVSLIALGAVFVLATMRK